MRIRTVRSLANTPHVRINRRWARRIIGLLAAVAKKLSDMKAGARVLTFCYDTGERYLSVEGLFLQP